ncbi:alpha-galactosidase [Chelativorans sp.]|uniref:glycoside hydrolase family 36 protein n=1 Tax=Chelativorans sp. TaxID=2203393 RepID=UPI002811A63B|nr:alpha-galactosidase [Chelativorans sp.]
MTAASAAPAFEIGGILLSDLAPLVDGSVPGHSLTRVSPSAIVWTLEDGRSVSMEIGAAGKHRRWTMVLSGFAGEARLASLGLRIGRIGNVRQYLRNGYMSWDGSYFVEPDSAREVARADARLLSGHAMTTLLPRAGSGATVLGFLRHDRYQSRLRFDFEQGPLRLDIETLIDGVPHTGEVRGETMVLFAGEDVEESLRQWARLVAEASPLPPRVPPRRIAGWCSWYNLYASLSEDVLAEHLEACRRFRDEKQVPFEIFQIDDGFTPEMGDWLETRPSFPGGMKPVMDKAREAGFTPGLWIAPFMVGNRSKLFAAHPDWVVRDRASGQPLAPMKFYGEFRWHKRSEEYYVLDITHPEAEAHIRNVFRIWARDWGCGYFKTDFMHLGSMYGPDEAVWHRDGLSRMDIWMKMARLIREEIGEALWLCCGAPIWAPVGLADAMRIGRDIGVSWTGHYSAESLLRDQTARNFANGILWQADPDCILLRERFHDLSDEQVRSLALFAGLAGGVLMTSDQLDEVPEPRRALLAELAGSGEPFTCDFLQLGQPGLRYRLGTGPDGQPLAVAEGDPVLLQRVRRADGSVLLNVFNTGALPAERLVPWELFGGQGEMKVSEDGTPCPASAAGIFVRLAPYQSRLLLAVAA